MEKHSHKEETGRDICAFLIRYKNANITDEQAESLPKTQIYKMLENFNA